MPILVQKYGGSSVADLQKLQSVAKKIIDAKQRGYDLVVVVSAMGDTTDELLDMARQLAPSPSRRELDMLLSVGERISMALLSMAIHQQGYEAISLTGSQCGIMTTASHSNARIMDVRPFRVQDELSRGAIVIVAGYQGTSYKREVTTLGRGGSDTTAVALAAALGAEACEIYSDVDGVFSADPRVVLDAEQLQQLSYEEMLELARSGARVLNAEAVRFAQQANIALYARSTHLPESKGTLIRPDGFDQRAALAEAGIMQTSASHIERGLLLNAQGADVSVLLNAINDEDIVCWTRTGRGEDAFVEVFLNLENIPGVETFEASLREQCASVEVRVCGLVSLVGASVGSKASWALSLDAQLEAADVDVLTDFVSTSRLSWVVNREHVHQAVNLLHEWPRRAL